MYTIKFDNGQAFEINGFSILGRNPDVEQFGGQAIPLVLNDLSKTVSKTHAALAVTPENQLLIEDLESTNGTFVEGVGEVEEQVLNGDPKLLANGTRARIGDVYFTVTLV
jgi:pSer/pThr/pTyr-binding forkhead associated (FHA) protein